MDKMRAEMMIIRVSCRKGITMFYIGGYILIYELGSLWSNNLKTQHFGHYTTFQPFGSFSKQLLVAEWLCRDTDIPLGLPPTCSSRENQGCYTDIFSTKAQVQLPLQWTLSLVVCRLSHTHSPSSVEPRQHCIPETEQ